MRGDSPSIEDCDWSKVQIGEGNDLYTNRHIAIDGKTICGAINADKLVQESAGNKGAGSISQTSYCQCLSF